MKGARLTVSHEISLLHNEICHLTCAPATHLIISFIVVAKHHPLSASPSSHSSRP